MKNERLCFNCQSINPEYAKFCVRCGTSLDGLKGKLKGLQKRIQHQSKEMIDNFRVNLDNQISDLLKQVDEKKEFKIKNYTVPENRKETIRNALVSFQSKIGTEESEEFKEWMDNLPEMLEDQKCIVCFTSWKTGDQIVVCKHCKSGGHRAHLYDWVKRSNNCPLCRQTISASGLLSVKI